MCRSSFRPGRTAPTVAADPVLDAAARARTLMARCELLARFSEEEGRLTRRYGTPALRAAQDAVAGWMTEAGMTTRRDALGNLIGRYEGGRRKAEGGSDDAAAASAPSPSVGEGDTPFRLPTLLVGGHLDTVRDAGKYDGTLGVLTGIACVERLRATGERLPFAVEVVAFADEEGLRFHTAYLGSWSFAGMLDPALLGRTDPDGVTIEAAIRDFGGDPAAAVAGARDFAGYLGWVEAHIEQGPILEAEGLPVGVVGAIAGQTRMVVGFAGEAGHAGTVPMRLRRDALCAAAEFVLAVEQTGRTTDGLVATVGQIAAEPGAGNVIPGRVRLSLDVRHAEDAVYADAVGALLERAQAIAAARNFRVTFEGRHDSRAVACDPSLTAALERAIAAAGYPVRRLVSGAGHDAVSLSTRLPVAMLFVRCAGGVSHNPAESITVEDAAAAIDVLDRFIQGTDQSWNRPAGPPPVREATAPA
jgi:allantoate deiminase